MKYYKDLNSDCIGTSAITGDKVIIHRTQFFKWNCEAGDKGRLYGYNGENWFRITAPSMLWDVFFYDKNDAMKELSEKEMFIEIL